MFVLRKFVGACLLCMALNGACGELVDINSANADALAETITGIGPARAAAIIDYRDSHGRFETVDDLVLVKGIGAKTIEKNRQKLTVSDKQ